MRLVAWLCLVTVSWGYDTSAAEEAGRRFQRGVSDASSDAFDNMLRAERASQMPQLCIHPVLDTPERLGYLSTLVDRLRQHLAAMREDLPAVATAFKYVPDAGEGFSSADWTHLYLWGVDVRGEGGEDGELLLDGWNTSACELAPNMCRTLRSAAVRPYLDGPLQWSDDMPGYAALYRTGPGGRVNEHAGGFRVNLQVVLQAPPGVVLKVGETERNYHEGEVVVWEDTCRHSVEHPAGVHGDRIVLSIKLPHPRVIEKHSQHRAKQAKQAQIRAKQAALRASQGLNSHADL